MVGPLPLQLAEGEEESGFVVGLRDFVGDFSVGLGEREFVDEGQEYVLVKLRHFAPLPSIQQTHLQLNVDWLGFSLLNICLFPVCFH